MRLKRVGAVLAVSGCLAMGYCQGEDPMPAAATAAKPVKKAELPKTERWLEMSEISETQRYRNSYDFNGSRLFDNGQQRTAIAGRLKLDAGGRYFVGFRVTSGRFFNWAYADFAGHDFKQHIAVSIDSFPADQEEEYDNAVAADPEHANANLAANGWSMAVRDLYFSATPVKPVTMEFGSIALERGYSTEITTFDDDGYIAGERVRLRLPKRLYFDEVGATNAYLGDIETPSFFARGDRLKQSNYRQVYAKKMIAKRVGVSAEYNWLNHAHAVREAALVKLPELKVVDDLRFELYQRLNYIEPEGDPINPGNGFAITVSKKLGRMSGDVGYASVEGGYSGYLDSRFLDSIGFSLNGDTYGIGNRVFAHMAVKVSPAVSVFGFYTHQLVGNGDFSQNRQGLNAGVKLDLKAVANSGRRIF